MISADLEQNGWCVLEQRLPRDLLDAVRLRVEARADLDPPDRQDALRSLGSLVSVLEDPRSLELLEAPALRRALEDAGLGTARFAGGYVLSKPGHSPATYWHQDWYFWDDPASYRHAAPQLGALIYLGETTRDNGALRVIPGSHLRQHPLHGLLASADVAELRRGDCAAALAEQPDEQLVGVRPGDVVLLDARCLHAAHANTRAARRTVVTIWLTPDFDALSEPVRAFIAHGVVPPSSWDTAARARLAALSPTYSGGLRREDVVLCASPDPRRRPRPR